jgi:hypothetical protein
MIIDLYCDSRQRSSVRSITAEDVLEMVAYDEQSRNVLAMQGSAAVVDIMQSRCRAAGAIDVSVACNTAEHRPI